MAKLPADLLNLVQTDKYLGRRPNWDEVSDPRYSKFIAPLTIHGSYLSGMELQVHVSKQWAHRDAMAQLEFAPTGRRSAIPLWRIDWRRFHSHVNKGKPADCPFQTFEGTHQHPFEDNYLPYDGRMLTGNLPAARGFESDPNTLSEFLAVCGKIFKISDMNLINLPSINGDLFWVEDD
jgi:hypothetical protein